MEYFREDVDTVSFPVRGREISSCGMQGIHRVYGPMNDSISSLTARIQSFVDAREWRQFHSAKDLSVAIAAEAGELMQHFVWQQDGQIDERVSERRDEIASEIADVGILLFEFADNLGLQLGDVMAAKLARNEQRYPVEKSRGNNLKYNQLG